MTDPAADQIAPLEVDDAGITLPTNLVERRTYDVLLNGQHVWSIQPARDVTAGSRRPRVSWPRSLRRHLRGKADVALRDHLGQHLVARSRYVFGGDDSRHVSVVDRSGNPLVIDKWGALIRPLSSDSEELTGELVDKSVQLMDAVHAAGLPAFVCYGTLLGAVREGRFIGHDNDVDLAFLSSFEHPADVVREGFRVERALREGGWAVRRGSGVRLNVPLELSDGSTRFVDVFTAHWTEGRLYIPSDLGHEVPREVILPLSTVRLHGRDVPAPARPEELLRVTYGDAWRVPDPSFRFESPRILKRRLNGWFGGLSTGRKRWDAFAATALSALPHEPTQFARWVAEQYPSDHPLVDLGAGTGRDSVWFADAGRRVIAVDYAPTALRKYLGRHARGTGPDVEVRVLNLYDLRSVLALGATLSRTEVPVDLYARFTLHALTWHGREHVFRLASMALRRGGHLFLEFRTVEDRDLPHHFEGGPRRFLRPEQVRRRIEHHGGRVVHQHEGRGLAEFEEEDPHVCRMIAAWSKPTKPPSAGA